jgi:predicted aminopeptidase
MTTYRTALFGLVLVGALLTTGSPVWAGGPEKDANFEKNHPRQTQVLTRVDRERNRVNTLYKQGKISAQQRDQQLGQIHSIRKEDYADAKANSKNGTVRGGHITKGQQGVMNQQENQINKEIRQDAK